MTRLLHRLGAGAATHPWRVLTGWLVVVVAAFGLAATVGGTPQDDWNVPGTPAQEGTELLRAEFPAAAGAQDRVVVHDPGGDSVPAAEITELSARLAGLPHVVSVLGPRVSEDGATVLLDVRYDVPVTDPDLFGDTTALEEAAGPAVDAGLQVAFGGEVPDSAGLSAGGTGEAVGVLVALALLVLTFGSVVAAGLPILVALLGLGVGSSGVLLLAAVSSVSTSAPTVATMVGLGVGIDYALLLVTRHVEGLRAGLDVRAAAATATTTAGRSVVFAGATVLVSLLGLGLAGLQTYASFGTATAIAVVSVMAAALTLVPAGLGLAGTRVLPRRVRTGAGGSHRRRAPLAARWAGRIGARALPWALGALLVLVALALPAFDMRIWPADVGAQPEDSTTRQAYDLIGDAFGPGANGPFLVAVDLDQVPAADLGALRDRLAGQPGVATVADPVLAPGGGAALVVVEPTTAPADARTTELLERLRADVLPAGASVTGQTAVFADINALLTGRLWLVIGFVVGVSVLVLTVAFRAPIVALKAAAMNLLSIGAAYGVVVAVFSWGWGRQLFGLDQDVPVSSWLPILMFAVAFGLSMDYEVFLLGRVREEWRRTGDARTSVVSGLATTGRLITAAAAIMVAVFLGFATEGELVLTQIGAGLAVAILVDATVVRMVLVPATMALLGHWNWWLPAWLDRVLPHLDLDGEDLEPADDAGIVEHEPPVVLPAVAGAP
ncbi:MMPL family transporter [Modestobacter roseus]|uniref:RND superfamily putative drug exporter n=1 Tax=Modestobacter roseus TaxID=1181884 RepID=A0A562IPE7_9ACTN|nr:MMPL family transporter [Modestobacter roseus]TWH72899.1 RND superfamily putative drug exporter [Modestobacter roseus]